MTRNSGSNLNNGVLEITAPVKKKLRRFPSRSKSKQATRIRIGTRPRRRARSRVWLSFAAHSQFANSLAARLSSETGRSATAGTQDFAMSTAVSLKASPTEQATSVRQARAGEWPARSHSADPRCDCPSAPTNCSRSVDGRQAATRKIGKSGPSGNCCTLCTTPFSKRIALS